jgi:putative selenium metabolism protein SsnA
VRSVQRKVDDWLIENGTVATLGSSPRVFERGAVLLKDGLVAAVGDGASVRKKAGGAKRLDAEGKLVLPGFVCAHHHLYSTFARGMALPRFAPKNFLQILEGLWWKLDDRLDEEDIYWSAKAALLECLKSGTTTVIDHHESQSAQAGSLIARAVEETGLRACLTLGVSDRYGRGREGLAENERFLRRTAGKGLVTGMVGLHASFTVKDGTLEACADLARRFGVGVHTHCAEDKADQDHARRAHGTGVVERFRRRGVLSEKALLVHCVHIDAREAALIKESGAAVVHNPESNMNNAVGAADVVELMRSGVRVGLGTDGMSSQMPLQARAAYLLQRHALKDPRAAFGEALEMLLRNNAVLAGRATGARVGELAPGAAGDAVVIDYRPPTPLSAENLGGHLLFGAAYARAESVFTAGRARLLRGRAVGLDEAEVAAKAAERAKRFWKKMLN